MRKGAIAAFGPTKATHDSFQALVSLERGVELMLA